MTDERLQEFEAHVARYPVAAGFMAELLAEVKRLRAGIKEAQGQLENAGYDIDYVGACAADGLRALLEGGTP